MEYFSKLVPYFQTGKNNIITVLSCYLILAAVLFLDRVQP